MSILIGNPETSVFGESAVINDGVNLKDPKPYREAYVVTELARRMSPEQLAAFPKSKHAQALVENEIIGYETLENLARGAYSDRSEELMVCHMAAENDDDRWNELVRHRAEERRLLDELIRDYGSDAQAACKQYNNDFVNRYVPGDLRGPGDGPQGVIHDET